MLLSQIIKNLEDALKQHGDQEVNIWIDSGEDTQYPAHLKQFELSKMKEEEFEDYYIQTSEKDSLYLNIGEYHEDEDSLYDMD